MERIIGENVEILEPIYFTKSVKVSKVKIPDTNETLCMKELTLDCYRDINEIQNDYLSMIVLDHPNIGKVRGIYFTEAENSMKVQIFMNYYQEKDLENLIMQRRNTNDYITAQNLISYIVQAIDVFAYMQDNNLAHRDIKPSNIFLSENGSKIIVGDFGDSVKKSLITGTTIKGTENFLSPNLLKKYFESEEHANHDVFKSDVFSLGLTFLCVASLKIFERKKTQIEYENLIRGLRPEYNDIKHLLQLMLKFEENQRYDFINLRDEILKISMTNSIFKNSLAQQTRNLILHQNEKKPYHLIKILESRNILSEKPYDIEHIKNEFDLYFAEQEGTAVSKDASLNQVKQKFEQLGEKISELESFIQISLDSIKS
ncbi:hypothetical protein SteCoe_12690 [Stentor coeruleus]|uniref:Protein kinase domain-containing protein n=1 Tax=Stentor coeruleus TaxID=5963 RepID=A0A1R2CA85_9CILI|nr:hypothetical protein SteCoe_12690 [Stentor coeruleus]